MRLPNVGDIAMSEALRGDGNALRTTVSRAAHCWHVAGQVNITNDQSQRHRASNGAVGIDLGATTLAALSTGDVIHASKPIQRAMRRMRIRGRRLGRSLTAAKAHAGLALNQPIPQDARLPMIRNRQQSVVRFVSMLLRASHLRVDGLRTLAARLCREHQAVALEVPNVQGMNQHQRLFRALTDVIRHALRRMNDDKTQRYGTRVIVPDRWRASSRLCSVCGWMRAQCGAYYERDRNAALNFQLRTTARTLPVASQTSNGEHYGSARAVVGGNGTLSRDDSDTAIGAGRERRSPVSAVSRADH